MLSIVTRVQNKVVTTVFAWHLFCLFRANIAVVEGGYYETIISSVWVDRMLCIMSVGQCDKKAFLSYCSGVRIVYFTTSVRAKQASSGLLVSLHRLCRTQRVR